MNFILRAVKSHEGLKKKKKGYTFDKDHSDKQCGEWVGRRVISHMKE